MTFAVLAMIPFTAMIVFLLSIEQFRMFLLLMLATAVFLGSAPLFMWGLFTVIGAFK